MSRERAPHTVFWTHFRFFGLYQRATTRTHVFTRWFWGLFVTVTDKRLARRRAALKRKTQAPRAQPIVTHWPPHITLPAAAMSTPTAYIQQWVTVAHAPPQPNENEEALNAAGGWDDEDDED